MDLGLLGYNLYLLLLGIVGLPVIVVRSLKKKKHWVVIPKLDQSLVNGTVWVVAESAGEVILAKTLVHALKEKRVNSNYLLITTTNSGYQMGKKLMGESSVAYLPFDYPGLIKTLLKRSRPCCLFMIENFFWPNLIRQASSKKIRTVVVNARISERVIRRNSYFRCLFGRTMQKIDRFYLQTEKSEEDYLRYGVKREQLYIAGDLKFDQQLPLAAQEREKALLDKLALTSEERLIVAGSTHQGEDEIVLEAFEKIHQAYPASRLLLAPRHLDRVDEVGGLLTEYGYRYQRFSEYQPSRDDVILLDTMGDLLTIYGTAAVVIVGGSFVEGVGGHNILEPAAQGTPVFYGPYMEGFKAPHEILSKAGVGFMVADSEALAEGCLYFIENPSVCEITGNRAKQLIAEHRGVSDKIAESILHWLTEVKQESGGHL